MSQEQTFSQLSDGMAEAVDRIDPALVQVNGRHRLPASGVIFNDGWVITASHVVEREDAISVVTAEGRELNASLAGRDIGSDLAVLQVEGLALEGATVAETVRVGELALAVGRTWGNPMASLGVVSAVGGPLVGRGRHRGGPRRGHRRHKGWGHGASSHERAAELMLERFIRTDATPYPGFSGGPLINARGEVLGILTTGLIGGVTLAVPARQAWQIGQSISQHGRVLRGYLGITSQPVRLPAEVEGQANGLMILEVAPNSPAERAGLLLGDVLLTLDGAAVEDSSELRLLLTGDRVGSEVEVGLLRGGQRITLPITIGTWE